MLHIKKLIFPTFLLALLLLISYSLVAPQEKNVYLMSDMERISITLPTYWTGSRDSNGFHLLTYYEQINILIDKSNEKEILKAIQNIGDHFKVDLKLDNITDFNTDKYSGLVADGSININNAHLKCLVIVLKINSSNIMFLAYTNKEFYQKLIEDMQFIINSIKPSTKKSGYVSLSDFGNYKIKLLSGWDIDFENKTYTLKKYDDYANIKITLSKFSDVAYSFEMFPLIFNIKKFLILKKEEKFTNDKEKIFIEATGLYENKEIGIIAQIIRFDLDIFLMFGYVDYAVFFADVGILSEIQRIMNTLSYQIE